MPHIRAVLVRDGDTLRIETNSAERMDRVLATLIRLDPTMRVLDDSRRPIRDAREAAELAAQLPAAENALDPDAPEVAAMLDEFIREYEANWLDEPIPALDGHTPRQAADDPTRRGDLIKLLDSFPADEDISRAHERCAATLRTRPGVGDFRCVSTKASAGYSFWRQRRTLRRVPKPDGRRNYRRSPSVRPEGTGGFSRRGNRAW